MRFNLILFAVATLALQATAVAQTPSTRLAAKYGSNASVGKTFTHDGVKLYYEIYGTGEPLLVVHGNAGSIADMREQIAFFRKHYQVIAMDSRDQGKSGDSTGAITYEKIADDLAALFDHLKVRPANVIGWSDGGNEALLLAIRHPEKVNKIAITGTVLAPQGAYQEIIDLVKSSIADMPAAQKETPAGKRELRLSQMLLDEPHIDASSLEAVQTPALVMAGDRDLIRDEHTLEIFHHLPNSQLCIFPNATHMIPYDNPAIFNSTVEQFFRTPFAKKDRIKDAMKTIEVMRGPAK